MLPVQVKVLSSSSCSLSEASALLQRFLSSDACSDSFASEYVANVAQALEDSIFRRAGGPESRGKHSRHGHFSASSSWLRACSSNELGIGKQSSLAAEISSPPHSHGKQSLFLAEDQAPSGLGRDVLKQSLLVAGDVVQDAVAATEAGSAMIDAENASRRHKKKRRHSAVENGFETGPPSALETEDFALAHHDKKRRRKERHEREAEFIRTEESADDRKHKKKRKDEQEKETENFETEEPALDNHKLHDKKKRRREKQGRDTEDMGFRDVTGYSSPPVPPPSLSIDENLGMKSAVKGKKKADAESIDANAFEVGVSFTPLSPNVEEHAGSSKRRRKQEKAGFLATPDKAPSSGKSREETDPEASPVVEFGSTPGEKKKKKKKRKRKEELGELVGSD